MSWARLDDGWWRHEKTEELRTDRQHDAITLFVLLLSYCGMKQDPEFTLAEAAMLLDSTEAEAAVAVDKLRSVEFIDDVLLRKHYRTMLQVATRDEKQRYMIHDWEEYRSKNEAKSLAGAKGGVMSGKSRRSRHEADRKFASKQTRSPDPDPGPGPDPDPDPGSKFSASCGGGYDLAAKPPPDCSVASRLEQLSSEQGWSIHVRQPEIRKAHQLGEILPHEHAHALSQTNAKKRDNPMAYYLGVVAGERQRAANDPSYLLPPAPVSTDHDGELYITKLKRQIAEGKDEW